MLAILVIFLPSVFPKFVYMAVVKGRGPVRRDYPSDKRDKSGFIFWMVLLLSTLTLFDGLVFTVIDGIVG